MAPKRSSIAAALLGAVAFALCGAACGRALPEDTPAATAPVETGAFDESQRTTTAEPGG